MLKIEIFGTPVITEDRVIKGEKKINSPPRRMREPSQGIKNESTDEPQKLEYTPKFPLMFHAYQRIDKRRKQALIKEAHSTHLKEKSTLVKAQTIGSWLGMDNEIKKYVEPCPIFQLQKTMRIKNPAKSIVPNIPLAPNEKLALDIFGPLPETQKENRYILSMQNRLKTYTVLVPSQNESTNIIIEASIDHYIYTFGAILRNFKTH